MRPPPQHSPLPSHLSGALIVLLPAWAHHKNGDTTKTPEFSPACLTPNITALPYPPVQDSGGGSAWGAFQGPPGLRCPGPGSLPVPGVPGPWARCRCPLPVPGAALSHPAPARSAEPGRAVGQEGLPGSPVPVRPSGCCQCCGTAWGPRRDGDPGTDPCAVSPGAAGCCRTGAAVPVPVPSCPLARTSPCTTEDTAKRTRPSRF